MIKKIHQTSKSKILEGFEKQCSDTLKEKNPEFEYKIWDDNDILTLSKKYYTDLEKIWDKLEGIQKAYLGRYLILYIEGGFYVDTDVMTLKPFSEFKLSKSTTYFAPSVQDHPFANKKSVTNYMIYNHIKGNNFFKKLLDESVKRIKTYSKNSLQYVPDTTGKNLIMSIKDGNVKSFNNKEVVDKFCGSTIINKNAICYHEGSTIRNGGWRKSFVLNFVALECYLRGKTGVLGNCYQAPIILISILLVLVMAGYGLSRKRLNLV